MARVGSFVLRHTTFTMKRLAIFAVCIAALSGGLFLYVDAASPLAATPVAAPREPLPSRIKILPVNRSPAALETRRANDATENVQSAAISRFDAKSAEPGISKELSVEPEANAAAPFAQRLALQPRGNSVAARSPKPTPSTLAIRDLKTPTKPKVEPSEKTPPKTTLLLSEKSDVAQPTTEPNKTESPETAPSPIAAPTPRRKYKSPLTREEELYRAQYGWQAYADAMRESALNPQMPPSGESK